MEILHDPYRQAVRNATGLSPATPPCQCRAGPGPAECPSFGHAGFWTVAFDSTEAGGRGAYHPSLKSNAGFSASTIEIAVMMMVVVVVVAVIVVVVLSLS